MPASQLEHRVNMWRGVTTMAVTTWSMALVLDAPESLLFWTDEGYMLTTTPTGAAGIACSALFLAYLLVDTAIGYACRQHFRRSMGPLYLHHVIVALGVCAFLNPSPPRGFFPYVWGEALTACRLLPPRPRFHARSAVFGFRRVLWLYLLARDLWYFERTSTYYGTLSAIIPPAVALILLALDRLWWAEHARSDVARKLRADEEEGCSQQLCKSSSSACESHHGMESIEEGKQSPDTICTPASMVRRPSALALNADFSLDEPENIDTP
jgi:hypothetical protein